ncbi:hypothetical protein C8R46DRAFT_1048031 [Mycena filopes]|nr:hypothetical protein C8R46DRAFT_1048031 [Mycena filopes]
MVWLWLGLKAMALARLCLALASKYPRPSHAVWLWPGLGLALAQAMALVEKNVTINTVEARTSQLSLFSEPEALRGMRCSQGPPTTEKWTIRSGCECCARVRVEQKPNMTRQAAWEHQYKLNQAKFGQNTSQKKTAKTGQKIFNKSRGFLAWPWPDNIQSRAKSQLRPRFWPWLGFGTKAKKPRLFGLRPKPDHH